MRPAQRSLMMSPYRFGMTSTSNCAGLLTCEANDGCCESFLGLPDISQPAVFRYHRNPCKIVIRIGRRRSDVVLRLLSCDDLPGRLPGHLIRYSMNVPTHDGGHGRTSCMQVLSTIISLYSMSGYLRTQMEVHEQAHKKRRQRQGQQQSRLPERGSRASPRHSDVEEKLMAEHLHLLNIDNAAHLGRLMTVVIAHCWSRLHFSRIPSLDV